MNLKKDFFVGTCFCMFLFLFSVNAQRKKNKETYEPKKIIYDNHIYEPYIRSVQLYPSSLMNKSIQASTFPPIVNLQDNQPLLLEFDCLNPEYQNFRVKIFHCDAEWTPSVLNEIEYLPEYNDFPINDYRNSFATKISYNHFAFELPPVKISGNYIVMVYKNRNEDDIMLTRKFMVFQNRVNVGGRVSFPNNAQRRLTHQQVNFGINYGNYEVIDPKQDLKILIRQNFRDDKLTKPLKPFMVDTYNRKLDFQFYDNENQFEGGNEFRMFDGRSTQQKLVNISKIFQGERESVIEIYPEKSQNHLAYVAINDMNGQYVIDNYETHRGDIESDYVRVSFFLRSDSLENKKVYVNGAFNDWKLNERNLMHYVSENQAYEVFVQLKQGIYNYNYVTVDEKGNRSEVDFEGSHSQTENIYEVLVYHRPIGARADALVGYQPPIADSHLLMFR
ncbi:MAG: DUF5103 domain-containing protein [Arcicella sp.]|nr:DUF5103 domain-containing protein [Arcicella sp.]